MVKRSSKTRKGRGIVSRVGSPFFHLMNATGETVGVVAGTVGNVAKRTVRGVSNTGRIWTSHVNMAAKNLAGRGGGKRRGTRRAGKRRGTRRA
jgi:hypothetical protein